MSEGEMLRIRVAELEAVCRDAYMEACGALLWGYDPNTNAAGALPDAIKALSEDRDRFAARVAELEAENAALREVYRRAVDTYPQPTPMTAELSAWWGAVYRSFLLASGEKT